MGGRFVTTEAALSPVMREAAKRGLGYLDDGTSPRSLASSLAAAQTVPFAKADLGIDAVPTALEIDKALARLEALAREHGNAIGTASALPVSIERIAHMGQDAGEPRHHACSVDNRDAEIKIGLARSGDGRSHENPRPIDPRGTDGMARYEDLPYRPCVGMMLLNAAGFVFIGRRSGGIEHVDDTHVWQMPQGGVDPGEDPWAAAKRELYEETNVNSVEKLGEMADWLIYDIPRTVAGRAWKGRYRGQPQKWFALRFTGEDSEIDVGHAGRRPQGRIRQLALGADAESSRSDRAVQAPGL